MAERSGHKWAFKPRFRKGAFGWRSQPAVQRVKQAVAEIKKAAKKDPVLAAEGAVQFLERVSPALEKVDSSSGAIGGTVYQAIGVLADVIGSAVVDQPTREAWLERLWEAQQADDIPYLEGLGDHWGALCVDKETASRWADDFVGTVRMAWHPDPTLRGHFKGTSNCLSAMLAAGRHDELLQLLDKAPYKMWHDRQYGVKALVAMGKKAEAIRYAESGAGLNDPMGAIAQACEEILLSSGMKDEAYDRYAYHRQRSRHLRGQVPRRLQEIPGQSAGSRAR